MAGKRWPEGDKRKAVTAYVVTGSLAEASKMSGIPRKTISAWKSRHPTWWTTLCDEIWKSQEVELQAGYRKTVANSMAQIHDRIEHGDHILRGTEMVRVPVKALDLAKIGGIAQDKLNLSLGKATSITGKQDEKSIKETWDELLASVADSPNVVPIGEKRG